MPGQARRAEVVKRIVAACGGQRSGWGARAGVLATVLLAIVAMAGQVAASEGEAVLEQAGATASPTVTASRTPTASATGTFTATATPVPNTTAVTTTTVIPTATIWPTASPTPVGTAATPAGGTATPTASATTAGTPATATPTGSTTVTATPTPTMSVTPGTNNNTQILATLTPQPASQACAFPPSGTCTVSLGSISGSGVSGTASGAVGTPAVAQSWTITLNNVAAGQVPSVYLQTSNAFESISCPAATANVPTTCRGNTSAVAWQNSIAYAIANNVVLSQGTVSGPGAPAVSPAIAAAPYAAAGTSLGYWQPPPPPPPPPPSYPAYGGGPPAALPPIAQPLFGPGSQNALAPYGIASSAVPIVPEADSAGLLLLGLVGAAALALAARARRRGN